MTLKTKKSSEDFVHLHVHSDMSQLDGCGKMSDYIEHAAKIGAPAIAFTEHGTMRGYHTAHKLGEKSGIKAIHGVEFYVSNDMYRKGLTPDERDEIGKGLKAGGKKAAIRAYEEREGIRDRWHLTVWAKNDEGLRNLYKLTSSAYLDGFYYKPRIDIPKLLEHGDGLMVATGCMSSVVYDRALSGKRKQAFFESDRLKERFGEDLWIEIQPHDMEDQIAANRFALELYDRYGGKSGLLATQDAHYVKHSDSQHHEVLLCIGTNSKMSDTERFKFDNDEFFMKSRKQMRRSFLKHHGYISKELIKQSLDNTMLFSEMVTAKVIEDYHAALLPKITIPRGYKDEWDYLKGLCFKGWEWRGIEQRAIAVAKKRCCSVGSVRDEYKRRLLHEMNALKKQRFVGYFLLVHDIYDFARRERIMCGPGRGSVAGSLVAFLIGFSSVDPIEHGLIFERFINPSRVDMPDVDMDFEDGRRHEIFEYLREKYGEERCAQIATIGKLSGKQCLRDVSRVFEVPLREVEEVSGSIIERASGDDRANKTIEDSFKEFKVCREFDAKYPFVLKHAKRLEGMTKNLGIHAAGAVVSPEPITNYLPLEVRKSNGEDVIVTALDKDGVAAIGLVKLDVLGLRTLTVLREACEGIEKNYGKWIDLESLPLDDRKVLDGFTNHDYVGIFQYDTPSADKACQGVTFDNFDDVSAMTALNRPGTSRSGLAAQFVARKKAPSKVKESTMHPKVTEITSDTLGIIVYQEHVIKIFTDIAGFDPGTADTLRGLIAKSKGVEAIDKERSNFIEGAVKNTPDMTKEQANAIFSAIAFFGSYGFNRSHAAAYSVIAYWTMWLKMYYPLEFFWALLKNEPDRLVIQRIAKDAKERGIKLLPPDVTTSEKHFSMDKEKNAIRGSLVDVKGVGSGAAETIMENQPFKTFGDFAKRVNKRKCNKGTVKALIAAGAFGKTVPNVKWALDNLEELWELAKKGKSKDVDELLKNSSGLERYTEEEEQLLASKVSPLAFGEHPINAYKKFMKSNIGVELTNASSETFFSDYHNESVYISGVIVGVKLNQVGDYHTGELPSETERAAKKWGARYANVNIEDPGGVQNRVKFDIDVFDDMRHLIDSGVGTPVVAHVNVNGKFQNMRANFAIDLEEYRKKVSDEKKLSLWETLISGKHPSKTWEWSSKKRAKQRVDNSEFHKSKAGGTYCGVVTHLKTQLDKRNNEMAFFGLTGAESHIEVLCFSSVWSACKKRIKVGSFIEIAIEKKRDKFRGTSYFYNGSGMRTLELLPID